MQKLLNICKFYQHLFVIKASILQWSVGFLLQYFQCHEKLHAYSMVIVYAFWAWWHTRRLNLVSSLWKENKTDHIYFALKKLIFGVFLHVSDRLYNKVKETLTFLRVNYSKTWTHIYVSLIIYNIVAH